MSCSEQSAAEGGLRPWHAFFTFSLGALLGLAAALANTIYLGLGVALTPFPLAKKGLSVLTAAAVVLAPFVEEPTKVFSLVFLKEEEGLEAGLSEWAWLGLASGLGFGLLETVFYVARASACSTSFALSVAAVRLLVAVPLHSLTTTVAGWGVGLWSLRGEAKSVTLCLAAAMCLHSVHNLIVVMASWAA